MIPELKQWKRLTVLLLLLVAAQAIVNVYVTRIYNNIIYDRDMVIEHYESRPK